MAKAASQSAQKIESELKSINVDGVADGMSESFDSEGSKIKEILSDVSADSRTKAERIAAEFRDAGMDSSAAMRKAWAIVKSESASGSRAVVADIDDIGDKAQSVGGSISSGIGGAFGKVAGAIGAYLGAQEVYDAGLTLIETAAELQAENAQFEQTFKDLVPTAEKSLNKIEKQTGITATRMRKDYTSIYAFSKAIGYSGEEAFGVADRAMVAAADAAAYFDMSMEDTSDRIKSFLKGNYEVGDSFNVVATETERNAKALELYGKKFNDLTEPEKVNALLSMIEGSLELSGATGQALREADSWANTVGELQDAWRQLAGTLGEPIKDAITPILTNATTLLRDLPGMIEEFDFSEAFGDIDLEPAKQSIDNLKISAGNLATTLTGSLKSGYDTVLQPLAEWYIEGQLAEEIQAISTAFGALSTALGALEPFMEPTKELFEFLQNFKFPTLATQINDLAEGFEFFKKLIFETGPGVSEITEEADTASVAIYKIQDAFQTARNEAGGAFGALVETSNRSFDTMQTYALGKIEGIQGGIDGLEGKTVYVDVVARMLQGGLHGALSNMPSDSSVDPAAYTPSYAYGMPTQIPYLATGAVIPPNAPFMAVLGDQTSGTNVEAPLETIKQAVAEVMDQSGGNPPNITIRFDGNLAQLGRVLHPVIEAESDRRGKNLTVKYSSE